MKISTILDKVDEKQLFVPAFQREYVWKRDDAKLLIDSLIKEYPTGTMLTWQTDQPPELKGPHKYNARRWCMNRNWPATNPTHRSSTYQERTTMAYRARPSG